MESVLKIDGLTKRYGKLTALNAVDLELAPGRIIGLMGPNSSGKTTLLKLCAGLLTPNAGSILVNGESVGHKTRAVAAYLPDKLYMKRSWKVRRLIRYFRDFYRDYDRGWAENTLQELGIPLKARFGRLSRGDREKVQLVLTMARRAKLYLLDEPVGGVDPASREQILNTVIKGRDPEATVLLCTHLIAESEPILDEFVFLGKGSVVRTGTMEEFRQEPDQTLEALFREVFACSGSF